ncbi:MAG: K(+)-transporting ATPase subunit C [Candidatus Schekmanbacteria bacterium]|nr:K(+)-transporting ATPase subunit C [Candidatus Schekmanbacteria bacterium]
MLSTALSPAQPASWVGNVRVAAVVTVLLAGIVCGAYPLAVWGLAQLLFPWRANGSLMRAAGGEAMAIVGSELLGQGFVEPRYFHPRPSGAGDFGHDPASSGGTNLGPTSARLISGLTGDAAGPGRGESFAGVAALVVRYRRENELAASIAVPADAVTRSASGVDPHISVRNARLQAPRVARARGMDRIELERLVAAHTQGRDLGFLGEPRVNVLTLNLALDARERHR